MVDQEKRVSLGRVFFALFAIMALALTVVSAFGSSLSVFSGGAVFLRPRKLYKAVRRYVFL